MLLVIPSWFNLVIWEALRGNKDVMSDEILLAVGSTLLGDSIEIQIFVQISNVVRRKKLVGRSSGARYNSSLKMTQMESSRAFLQSLPPGRVCAYWSCNVSFAERLSHEHLSAEEIWISDLSIRWYESFERVCSAKLNSAGIEFA